MSGLTRTQRRRIRRLEQAGWSVTIEQGIGSVTVVATDNWTTVRKCYSDVNAALRAVYRSVTQPPTGVIYRTPPPAEQEAT